MSRYISYAQEEYYAENNVRYRETVNRTIADLNSEVAKLQEFVASSEMYAMNKEIELDNIKNILKQIQKATKRHNKMVAIKKNVTEHIDKWVVEATYFSIKNYDEEQMVKRLRARCDIDEKDASDRALLGMKENALVKHFPI